MIMSCPQKSGDGLCSNFQHTDSCAYVQGTTHVFRLSLPGKEEGAPPHLVAAAMPAAARREFRPVKLVAAGRARGAAGMLNGSIPGSAAASAAVNLYNGSAGECGERSFSSSYQKSHLG